MRWHGVIGRRLGRSQVRAWEPFCEICVLSSAALFQIKISSTSILESSYGSGPPNRWLIQTPSLIQYLLINLVYSVVRIKYFQEELTWIAVQWDLLLWLLANYIEDGLARLEYFWINLTAGSWPSFVRMHIPNPACFCSILDAPYGKMYVCKEQQIFTMYYVDSSSVRLSVMMWDCRRSAGLDRLSLCNPSCSLFGRPPPITAHGCFSHPDRTERCIGKFFQFGWLLHRHRSCSVLPY